MTAAYVDGRPIAQNNKELLGNISGIGINKTENETKDGAAFVESTLNAANALDDYSFHYKMTCFKSSKPVTEEGDFYFRKPKLMRLVQTAGPKQGSIAVLGKDGKVKAHMGGALKLFVVTLDPDSDLLKSANGWPMVRSDFASLAQAIKDYLKDGMTSKVNTQSVLSDDKKVFVVEVYKTNGELYKRYNVDSQSLIPVEWWDFQGGKLYAHSNWSDIKTNQNLPDSLFTIKGRSKDSKATK
jgi:outer membrane lipoprotein-sorting protein